jgi:aminoglycoside phosphotransferase (APT) family kinase protein
MDEAAARFLPMLREAGLAAADEAPAFRELTGGVASDIRLADLRQGPVCVKQALAKLRVCQDWRAPVERNAYEAAWLETAGRIVPGAAPRVLARDPNRHMFAMEYLDPARCKSWKAELMAGRADPRFAARVGDALARIHSATAGDPATAAHFPTDAIFHAIRLAPYLETAAAAHPDLQAALADLVRVTAATRRALVHGDVSPKNILVGPDGPVFLDAECAWYGDPAFDVAFCLNHLLLKCLARPAAASGFLDCFRALAEAYVGGAPDAMDVEGRAARLLPGLMLARVDGKSPVEYLSADADKNRVRRVAAALLARPPSRLAEVARAWAADIGATA